MIFAENENQPKWRQPSAEYPKRHHKNWLFIKIFALLTHA
jgi:hypothetical protein